MFFIVINGDFLFIIPGGFVPSSLSGRRKNEVSTFNEIWYLPSQSRLSYQFMRQWILLYLEPTLLGP